MATNTQQILKEALSLPVRDRAMLVDDILASLDQPDEKIDRLWRTEVDDRVAAYRAGKIRAVPLEAILSKHHR